MPRRYTSPDLMVVELVLNRCRWTCEVCAEELTGWRGERWSLHHRRGRDGRPDSHSVQNLMAVHGASNVDGCHGLIHSRRSESQPNGWWLSRNARPVPDPLTVPVLIERGSRWVYFTADGRYAEPRDPYRNAVLAPVHEVTPVRCACGHAALMHGERSGLCLSFGCDCPELREAS